MSKDVQGSCGTCVVCCQWLDIESEELSKKAGILCEHCVGSGCGLYETRPQVCRGFDCGYRLISQLGEEWRPDRCGIVVSFNGDERDSVLVHLEPERPDALAESPGAELLAALADAFERIIIVCGEERMMVSRRDAAATSTAASSPPSA